MIIVAFILHIEELRLREVVCPKPCSYVSVEQGFQLRKSNSKASLLTTASYQISFSHSVVFFKVMMEVIPRHLDFINQYYQNLFLFLSIFFGWLFFGFQFCFLVGW